MDLPRLLIKLTNVEIQGEVGQRYMENFLRSAQELALYLRVPQIELGMLHGSVRDQVFVHGSNDLGKQTWAVWGLQIMSQHEKDPTHYCINCGVFDSMEATCQDFTGKIHATHLFAPMPPKKN